MQETKMPLWLHQRALLTPERIAYETEDSRLTFHELDQSARQLAWLLSSKGIAEGSHVAVLQENTLNFVRIQHALMYLHAICVPLNLRLATRELSFQLSDCAAGFLIADSATYEKAQQANTNCQLLTIEQLLEEETDTLPQPMLQREINLNDPCTIIYTSGTTGRPKGVVLTYGSHWWNANASLINLGLRETDEWLCCVPLFHVSGLSILIKNVIYGMPVFLCRHFHAADVLQQILAGKISHISLVASMLQRVLDGAVLEHFPETFRCVLLGGGPVPPILLKRCLERQIPVYQTYGMTETASQCVTLPPEYMQAKAGSAGKALFPLQIQIDSGTRPAEAGEPGEILVKGPTVFSHYLNREDATRDAFTDGWFRTGDIGYLDADGFLFVLDRRKDLIISGGENIYPAEVEAVLRLDPNVTGAGVIGIPDPDWGQKPIAFVTVHRSDAFDADDLIALCRSHLAHYKVPKQVILRDELPENAAHKLLRRKLYERWLQENPSKQL